MAATVIVERLTGAGPTATDIRDTVNRVSRSDVVVPALANPVDVPVSGTIYSHWVVVRLRATVAPANKITDIKYYTDGVAIAGLGTVLAKVGVATTYVQAAGLEINAANYSTLVDLGGGDKVRDAFSYTVGAPLNLTALGMADITPSALTMAWYVVYQYQVTDAGLVGLTDLERFTLIGTES